MLLCVAARGYAAAATPACAPRARPNAPAPAAFYVSPTGSDAADGTTPSTPFLTPARAALAVLDVQRPLAADLSVFLAPGVYALNATLTLGPGAGGDGPAARVVWAKLPGAAGDAVLSGAAPIARVAWAPAGAGAVVAPLPAGAPARARSLLVRGEPRFPARVPPPAGGARGDAFSDAGTLHYVSSLDGCGFAPGGGCWAGGKCNRSVDAWGFVYNASDARGPSAGWRDVPGVDVLAFGAWTAAWARVLAVVPGNATLLTTSLAAALPGEWGGAGCPSGARFVLSNVAEALAPGTFYVDDAARTVTYALLPGEDAAALDAAVPALGTVLAIQGDDCGGPIAQLEIRGLNFSGASDNGTRYDNGYAARGAVEVGSARDVALRGCGVRASDASGVLLRAALVNVALDRVYVGAVGGDGVGAVLGQSDDAVNTTITDSTVENTGGVFFNQPAGIRVQGAAGVVVAHNLVRDTAYAGIMVGWQAGSARPPAGAPPQFLVEGNLVEDAGNGILSDFGGIYVSTNGFACQAAGTCWLPTLVRGNRVRRVRGYNYGGEGFYADENVAGVDVVGNALGDVSGAAVYLHCGDGQRVTNNILFGAHAAPAGGAARGAFAPGLVGSCNTGGVSPADENITAAFSTNVLLVTNTDGTLFDGGGDIYPLDKVRFDNNTYWSALPGGAGLAWPLGGAVNATFAAWRAAGQDAGGGADDPRVADAQAGDFRLADGSPALARGFVQLEAGWGPRAVARVTG